MNYVLQLEWIAYLLFFFLEVNSKCLIKGGLLVDQIYCIAVDFMSFHIVEPYVNDNKYFARKLEIDEDRANLNFLGKFNHYAFSFSRNINMSQELKQKQNLPVINKASKTKLKLSESNGKNLKTARSISAFSIQKKYDNVEKIATIVQQFSKQSKKDHRKATREQSLHDKVIQTFKEKIKNNFNDLYQDYEGNKERITFEIKNLEKNKTAHTEMTNRFQQSLKEKSQYDRLRVEVEKKKVKLERLKEILEKQKNVKFEGQQLKEELDIKIQDWNQIQKQRDHIEYQRAILQNMRKEKREVRRIIKQRFEYKWADWVSTNRKINQFWNQGQHKRLLLQKITQQMPPDPEMPDVLAQELERKIQKFYGKQAFINILHHENIRNEEANRKQLKAVQQQRTEQLNKKLEAEREQKEEYEIVQRKYLQKLTEEQKIRKSCAINNLNQISQKPLMLNEESLNQLKQQFQQELDRIRMENLQIEDQIKLLLSKDSKVQQNLRSINKAYQKQHDEEKRLAYQVEKCHRFLEKLQLVVDRITQEIGTRKQINLKLASFSSKYQKYTLMEQIQSQPNKSKQKIMKKSIKQQQKDSQDQIKFEEEQDYIDQQFIRSKPEQFH